VPETATIKCMSWSRGAMGGYRTVASMAGDAIDQSDEPATLGGPARLVIGAAVFLLGMLVGGDSYRRKRASPLPHVGVTEQSAVLRLESMA
jgi:hypothetical protein